MERVLASSTPELLGKLEAAISQILVDPSPGPRRTLAPDWSEWRECIVDDSVVDGDYRYYIAFIPVLAGEEYFACLIAIQAVKTNTLGRNGMR